MDEPTNQQSDISPIRDETAPQPDEPTTRLIDVAVAHNGEILPPEEIAMREAFGSPETPEEGFTRLCAALSKTCFTTPLSEAEQRVCDTVQNGNLPGKNVYLTGNNVWVVKYYKGGKQRVWAHYNDVYSACRLADILITQFNSERTKHRIQGLITDDHLNITPQRAKQDWDNENDIKSIIFQMDACLPDIKKGRNPGRPKTGDPSPLVRVEAQLGELFARVEELTKLVRYQSEMIAELVQKTVGNEDGSVA